jgi:hypothetical protein
MISQLPEVIARKFMLPVDHLGVALTSSFMYIIVLAEVFYCMRIGDNMTTRWSYTRPEFDVLPKTRTPDHYRKNDAVYPILTRFS